MRRTSVLFLALLLALCFGGCDGDLNDPRPGNTGDDDDAVSTDDDDDASDDFAATIATELPVTGTFVVGSAQMSCIAGDNCDTIVDHPDMYRLDVDCPNHGFIDQFVSLTQDDDGATVEVDWDGAWGAMPEGLYTGSDGWTTYEVNSEEISTAIEINIGAMPATVTGQTCYGENESGFWVECEISEDNSQIYFYAVSATGFVIEDTITLD